MTAAPARPARDVLTLPLIGRMLKHRSGRVLLQIPFLLLAVLLIYDGFTGPQRAAENLATVVPWVHFRGVVVIALLLFGNLICMGCPFTLTRSLGRRFASPKRRFPRVLRSKWIAIATLIVLFIAYEWLNLWASPWLTAWLIVGYFAASFILELLFAESAFCKYVCPLGSFNFAYSSGAPLMIEAKDPELCKVCVGKECVNGSFALTPLIRVDTIPVAGRPEGRQVQVTHDRAGVLGCGTEAVRPADSLEPRLYVVPRLRARLPARQRRPCRAPPVSPVVRPRRVAETVGRDPLDRRPRQRRDRQRVRHDPAGVRGHRPPRQRIRTG